MPANLPHQQIARKANFALEAVAFGGECGNTFRMTTLRALRKAKSWTQQQLAERADVDYTTISRIETGKRWFSRESVGKLARALDTTPAELLGGRPPEDAVPPIAVAGQVGAGASVELVDAYAKGAGLFYVEAPADIDSRGIVAVEVVGDSMTPLIPPGSVLLFSRHFEGVAPLDLGRVVICETDDGRAWVKQIRQGRDPGTYDLHSARDGLDPIYGQHVRWAARMKSMIPPEDVVRVENIGAP